MELFSSRTPQKDFDRRALSLGAARHVPESGFLENWGEALRLDLDEASSLSKGLNNELYQERENEIWKLYDDGQIPKEVMQQYTLPPTASNLVQFDFNALSRWANDNLGTEFLSDEEIMDNIREDLLVKRNLANEVFSRANWWGKFGQFMGSAHAASIDPVLLPTYFVGLGAAAKGATWFTRFGRAAAPTVAAELGSEVVRQPTIYSWKNDIASDYSFSDAMANVLVAGLGAGTIAGTAGSLSVGLKNLVRKNQIYGSSTSMDAAQAVDGVIRELDRSPNPEKDAAAHLGEIEDSVTHHQSRKSAADEPVETKIPEEETIPPEDLDEQVVLETVDGTMETVTIKDVVKATDDLETQIEAVRGCIV